MNYITLLFTSFLFSLQFLFTKKFQQFAGESIVAAIFSALCVSVVSVVSMLITSGCSFQINGFALLMSFLLFVNNITYAFFNLKAVKYANVSMFAMFNMLGSIFLPSLCGILFFNEKLTVALIFSYIFIIIAMVLSIKGDKSKKGAAFYYIAVFTLNGLGGVISKIYYASPDSMGTDIYLFTSNVMRLAVCAVLLVALAKKVSLRIDFKKTFALKSSVFSLLSGLSNLLGNFWSLALLTIIPVSVHSLVTSGGTIVFSALIDRISGQKINLKGLLSLIIAVIAIALAII